MALENPDPQSSKTGQSLLPTLLVILIATGLLFRSFFTTTLPFLWGDDFDPRLIAWAAEWGFQKIFILHQPLGVFQANIFFPHPNTLAYSDSLLSIQLFYAPLRLVGLSSWAALYGALALSTIGGALLTALAASRLWNLSAIENAILVFCAHFSLPFVTTLNHYQLFGFQFAPALILFTLEFIRSPNSKILLGSALIFAFGTGFAMYLAPMSVAVIFFLLLLVIGTSAVARRNLIGALKMRQSWLGFIGILLVLYVIQLRPYFIVQKEFPPQSLLETWSYSARLGSILFLKSMHSFWYGSGTYSENGDWERAIFPGYLLLACLVTTSLVSIGSISKRLRSTANQSGEIWLLGKDGLPTIAVFMFVVCLILSLGPFYDSSGTVKLPYYYLTKILPGLKSLRAPGRFGMLMGLPLGIAAVVTLRTLRKFSNYALAVSVVFLMGIATESLPTFTTHQVPLRELEALAEALKPQLPHGAPVVLLPTASGDHYATLKMIMAQMNAANVHGGSVVVGYAAKSTRESDEIVALDGLIQRGGAAPEQLITFIRTIPAIHIVVDRRFYPQTALPGLEEALSRHSAQKTELLNGNAALYVLAAS